ncbi:hypothetical protein HYX58_02900 [Candidatus Dependentiae bacterium]|nr:hypothetical protein [Candidatus Dependentiae bacterium]
MNNKFRLIFLIIFTTATAFPQYHIPKTKRHSKSATTITTKAEKLQKEKKELEQQNADLTEETLNLRADGASLSKEQDAFHKVGKSLASISLKKEDECSLFINTAGKVIQSITFHEGSRIGFDKKPIYDLFAEQQKKAKKPCTQNCGPTNIIPTATSFIKQSFAPFIAGMIVATGGCAAFYFAYLKKK